MDFKEFSSNSYKYLTIPLNINYYLLASPIQVSRKGQKSTACSNLIQTVLCILAQLLVVAFAILNVVTTLQGEKVKDKPSKLFDIAQEVAFIFAIFFWIKSCWAEQGIRQMLKIHQLNSTSLDQTHFGKFVPKTLNDGKLIWLTCLCYPLLVGFMRMSHDLGLMSSVTALEAVANKSVEWQTKFHFYDEPLAEVDLELTSPTFRMTMVFMALEWYWWIFDACTLTFWFTSSFAIDTIAAEYKQFLTDNPNLTLHQVRKSLEQVREMVESINDALGYFTVTNFISSLSYFGKNAIGIVDSNIWAHRIETTADVILIVSVFVFAARGNHKFSEIERHVLAQVEHFRSTGSTDSVVILFLIELGSVTKNLGLRGGNFFIITYGFLGTFAGTFATFLIIILQFESTKI